MGLTVSIENFSNLAWARNNWHVGAGKSDDVNWTDEVTQVPAEHIEAHDGATTAAASSEHLSWLVEDALWITVGYGSSEGDFAVNLEQYFHLFGIGGQCGWDVWEGSSWRGSTTRAEPYTWHFASCRVLAVPTLSDSGASVNVTIADT
ncbi:hypothetical protein [Isoptericola aurantiacus]|uniref:hypothetical protein n=1 Tax=Isoptericola aurantiacus TaxID=3377839 RepID=UPI00383B639D